MSNEDDISPLLAMRQKLDNQIAGILEKVAGIRKKRDVLQNAIEVLRSSDEDLNGYPSTAPRQPRSNPTYNYNSAEVEAAVLSILDKSGPLKFRELLPLVVERGQNVSKTGLRNVLSTCPHITVVGQRDQTRYRRTVLNTVGEGK